MEDSVVPSLDSGVCCTEESPVDTETSTSRVRSLVKALSHCNEQRNLRSANVGAFRGHEVITCAVPFVFATAASEPSAPSATEEGGNADHRPQRNQAQGSILQDTSPDRQSSTDTTAQLLGVQCFLVLILLLLSMLERRFASLQAFVEAISTSPRVPSTRIMQPGTSPEVDGAPRSDATEESAPSDCHSGLRDNDRCQRPGPHQGPRSVARATPRKHRRCRLHRELSSRTPIVVDCIQEPKVASALLSVEQEQSSGDERHSQAQQADTFATYKPGCLGPEGRDNPCARPGQFLDLTTAQPTTFTWTPDSLERRCSQAGANGRVEVFSPASEVSGYVVRLYARSESRDGFAMLSFCAQLCASVKNHAVPWPFRGTLNFVIHHSECSEKSRLYIVPALLQQSDAAVSGVGKTLFRLTGPIPATTLQNEGLWAAGTLRMSISVRK